MKSVERDQLLLGLDGEIRGRLKEILSCLESISDDLRRTRETLAHVGAAVTEIEGGLEHAGATLVGTWSGTSTRTPGDRFVRRFGAYDGRPRDFHTASEFHGWGEGRVKTGYYG